MFFRKLVVSLTILIAASNAYAIPMMENGDRTTLISIKEVALGKPCRDCILSLVDCRSYITTPSTKICLPSGSNGENDETFKSEEVVTEYQGMENDENLTTLPNNSDSPEYITPEQIDDNIDRIILQEYF